MITIAIIGGGAAGLMAALTAAGQGAEVTVFEHNTDMGKKILASGNGRCNIINQTAGIEDFEGEDPSFASFALEAMRFRHFEQFCKTVGLLLAVREDGKCYPLSNESKSVQQAFIRAAEQRGVIFKTSTLISGIQQEKGGFVITTAQSHFAFDRVIIATGSAAAPQLGGNASGMQIAGSFGHRIVEPFPSLVGLHLKGEHFAKMAGVKTTALLSLLIDNHLRTHIEGDILFTRYGISGFAVLDVSHYASAALTRFESVKVQIDLLPHFTQQSLASQIEQLAEVLEHGTLFELLGGLLPHKLIQPLLAGQNIPNKTPCRQINAKLAKKVAHTIKQWPFEVTDTHGYEHAEAAGGGVATDEINAKTMESLRVPNLFFAGEVIDMTGRRGGFNFHFAWGSGYLAGMHAAAV